MPHNGRTCKEPDLFELYRIELRRATGRNPWFWLVFAVGAVLALWAAFSGVPKDYEVFKIILANWPNKNYGYGVYSCFAQWMPIRSYETAAGAFFMVWPLLAVLPYSWCLSSDVQHGVLAQQCARASRRSVVTAKILAASSCGSLAVGVPLVVNLVANACVWPAETSILIDTMMVGVGTGMPLVGLFYAAPLLACIVWTLVCAFVAGVWSAAVCGLSFLARNFLETTVATYLLVQALAYVGQQLFSVLVGLNVQDNAVMEFAYQLYYGFNLMHMLQFNVVWVSTLVIQGVAISVFALICWCCSLRKDVL